MQFTSRPGDDVVADFHQHLTATAKPHTWKWHSHTKPDRHATPVLIAKFGLPDEVAKKPELWAMCPICAPEYPRYTWGYLTWYPESSSGDDRIRAIGHDCGKRYFGSERYRGALRVFEREQDEAADRAYLERMLPTLSALQTWLRAIEPWANAAASLSKDLRAVLPRELLQTLLRAESNGGRLFVHRQVSVPFIRVDGTEGVRQESQSHEVATVVGPSFLASDMKDWQDFVSEAHRILAKQNTIGEQFSELDADKIAVATKELRHARDLAETTWKNVRAACQFAAAQNVANLQKWSISPGSEAQAQLFSLDGFPKITVLRYRKSGIPSLGFREKQVVEIAPVLRLVAPEPPF